MLGVGNIAMANPNPGTPSLPHPLDLLNLLNLSHLLTHNGTRALSSAPHPQLSTPCTKSNPVMNWRNNRIFTVNKKSMSGPLFSTRHPAYSVHCPPSPPPPPTSHSFLINRRASEGRLSHTEDRSYVQLLNLFVQYSLRAYILR